MPPWCSLFLWGEFSFEDLFFTTIRAWFPLTRRRLPTIQLSFPTNVRRLPLNYIPFPPIRLKAERTHNNFPHLKCSLRLFQIISSTHMWFLSTRRHLLSTCKWLSSTRIPFPSIQCNFCPFAPICTWFLSRRTQFVSTSPLRTMITISFFHNLKRV